MSNTVDLIIVGAGPIGLACAIEAKKENLRYIILEKGTLTNSLYNYPLYMTFFSTAERLEIGDIPFNCIAPKPGRQEALEYYRNIHRYHQFNLHLYEEVINIEKSSDELFKVETVKTSYTTRHIILATGFYDHPIYLGIEGENLPKVHHYFKEAHPFAFQKVVVVGANNSAVDAALECYRKGAQVTMIIRNDGFTDRLKYWVRPDIENRIKEGSIKAYFESNLIEIKENSVIFKTKHGTEEIDNDVVLAMTGYQPDFDFLENCGIAYQNPYLKIPIYNPETMESNVKNFYLAGVVCGGMETHKWFIENSRIHAQQIINDIKTKR
ncbi:YpdA family putative bacillithiol disulfide reductase [Vaginella massiliensis]|uniref:YpdA family putative bacillithiol disulfide reductase n=1 Tax=Vaginella massiliensis TaxID=1816680 RepID=UPI000838667E|nr:YpdA family putative bacillithiol disulfide reductase [Vaginella massiliensis]